MASAAPVPSEPLSRAESAPPPMPIAPLAPPAPPVPLLPPALPVLPVSPSVAGAAPQGDRELPVYCTLIAPAVLLRYAAQRGAEVGQAELQWAPAGPAYEARLSIDFVGKAPWVQHSAGGFDESGVAPLRQTEARPGSSVAAVNFQREKGAISFSGPGAQYPLLMGSQDRLSWMMQLAAIASAEPQRLAADGKIVIHVSGPRGDSQVWVFRSLGTEVLPTPLGDLPAVHLLREAPLPYDARVDVWLDPQNHHLPARLLMHHGRDDQALELKLVGVGAAP
jgi:hypothetical protein